MVIFPYKNTFTVNIIVVTCFNLQNVVVDKLQITTASDTHFSKYPKIPKLPKIPGTL